MKYLIWLPWFIALTLTSVGSAQDKVDIAATDLGGGVFMLSGSGGNMGLSTGNDGAFLVDDQFAPLSDEIKATIAKLSKSPVKFWVNTHWHGDHTGGNENFGTDGAIIVAHDNVRERLSSDQFIEMFNSNVKASPKNALPIITFYREISFFQNGQSIRLLHVKNAHTDGDAFVYFYEADVMHMGDVFFNGSYPFIDVGNGGSIDGVIAAQKLALVWMTDRTKIIPGHGPLASRSDLVEHRQMLIEVRDAVAATIDRGLSVEQAVAADPLSALNAKWGNGFIKSEVMVKMVYEDLVKNASKTAN